MITEATYLPVMLPGYQPGYPVDSSRRDVLETAPINAAVDTTSADRQRLSPHVTIDLTSSGAHANAQRSSARASRGDDEGSRPSETYTREATLDLPEGVPRGLLINIVV